MRGIRGLILDVPYDRVAVIALCTRAGGHRLFEVVVQKCAPAGRGLGELDHFRKGGTFRVGGQCKRLARAVGLAKVQDALAVFPVASGTTRFLHVIFDRRGHVQVDDTPHIGLVDAHPKRNSRNHDVARVHHKRRVCRLFVDFRHVGVVRHRTNAVLDTQCRKLVYAFFARSVDDGRLAIAQ